MKITDEWLPLLPEDMDCHEDKGFARLLYERLHERGIRCWLDEDQLLPGDDLHDGIDGGIRL